MNNPTPLEIAREILNDMKGDTCDLPPECYANKTEIEIICQAFLAQDALMKEAIELIAKIAIHHDGHISGNKARAFLAKIQGAR